MKSEINKNDILLYKKLNKYSELSGRLRVYLVRE